MSCTNLKGICKKLSSRKSPNVKIMAQIVMTLTANALTWISSGSIYILTLTSWQYPLELVLWTIVAIEPINSVVNPFLFIMVTVRN